MERNTAFYVVVEGDNVMYKQIIIARRDLGMSAPKLASQVSHGSMAFITNMIREKSKPCEWTGIPTYKQDADIYCCYLRLDKDLYEQWIDDIFTKVVLEAKNKNHLLNAKTMAEEMGMVENKDFFCIYDCCKTELEPEFVDENGVGRTLTCIGFRPLEDKVIDKIGKKYQLYK